MKGALRDDWDVLLWYISEEVSEGYPDIDPQDVFSSVYVLLYELRLSVLEPGDPGTSRMLRDAAKAAAWNMRAEQLRLTSQYTYRVRDVSEIMETVFDREDWPAGFTPPDAMAGERDRMAPLEVRMDAWYGYKQLPPELRDILISRFYDKVVPVSSQEENALNYALTRLTEEMNRFRG